MEILRFALLGLATGSVYALLAQGVVLVYRGSGLLNFAQGAVAMFGAYGYYELSVRDHMPKVLAAVVAIVACAVLGGCFQLVVLRAMRNRNASPLTRVISTLSLLLILQSAALLRYGSYPLTAPSLLPTGTVHVFSNQLPITVDRLYIFGLCLVISAVLYAVYRWASFGRITAAVAENELAAASFGYSPDRVAAINWAIGSALAGLAGILIAPIIFLEPNTLVLLIVPAMTVALVGGFSSFPVVLVAALSLGIAQSEISRYVQQGGWATAAPFLVVIAYLVVRGRGLPLRSFVLDRLPAVGTGRVRPWLVAILWGGGAWAAFGAGGNWDAAMVTTVSFAIICLSVVLLTGYAGQLSLAQFVIAGVGALTAAKLISHMPFLPALVLASLFTGAVGVLVGLPALRTRGATLGVATLGLGSAIVAVVFNNSAWTGGNGGLGGITLPSLSVFGWSIDPVVHPDRYTFVTLSILLVIAVVLANLRRGMTGRQLLAVRSNERAAASLGVPVSAIKAYAFFLAAIIAAVGGIMLAFAQPTLQMAQFDVFTCVLVVGVTVTMGVGYLPGGIEGALLIAGGVFTLALASLSSLDRYLPFIGSVLLLVTLVTGPDGAFALSRAAVAPVVAALDRVTLRRTRVKTTAAEKAGSPSASADSERRRRFSLIWGCQGGAGRFPPNPAGRGTRVDRPERGRQDHPH